MGGNLLYWSDSFNGSKQCLYRGIICYEVLDFIRINKVLGRDEEVDIEDWLFLEGWSKLIII